MDKGIRKCPIRVKRIDTSVLALNGSPRDHPELRPLLLLLLLPRAELPVLELSSLFPLVLLSLMSSNRLDGGLGS